MPIPDVPEGEPWQKTSQLAGAIRDDWNAMTLEEKFEATQEGVQDLQAHHNNKALVTQNVPTHVFQDAHCTLDP